MMDLKFKGITWVGNIYQKFEAMCLEVDDIVSQDPVKYVENQVQTVGESVKKFYSDVVQDLLPPLVDPVKCDSKAVSLKQNAPIGTYIKSMIGVEEYPVDIGINQSSVEPDAIDPLKKQLGQASSFSGLCHVNQLTAPPSVGPIRSAEPDLALGQNDNVLIYKNSDVSIEDNSIKEKPSSSEVLELIPSGEKDSCEASLISGSTNQNHENACGILTEVSPATSVPGAGFESPQKVGTICNDFVDETESSSDVSSTLSSSELDLSVVSSENNVAEMELISSSSSLSTESYGVLEISRANSPQKAGEICNNPIDATGCVSDIPSPLPSSESVPIMSREIKEAEIGLASSSSVLPLESNDLDTSRTNETVSLIGSFGNRHEQFCDSTQLKDFMSSETGGSDGSSDDITDLGMETIELYDKIKLEESCVIVDNNALYAVSRRARKLRSYKKKIQDAFTSKKRLAKEYEQLAIWYGDIDTESSQHTAQNLLPSIPTSLDSKKLPANDLCDSEWELL